MSKFTWNGQTYYFGEKRTRNPPDRAAVDKLRRYVKARGGTVLEFDYDRNKTPSEPLAADFVFAWEGKFVSRLICVGGLHKTDITPPEYLNSLKHLQRALIQNYAGDLSWLGKLSELQELSIDPAPLDADLFPASWACVPSLNFLCLGYQDNSAPVFPESVRNLRELHNIRIFNYAEKAVKLPECLGDLPNLREIRLQGRFVSIPYSLARTGLPFRSHYLGLKAIILNNVTLDEGDVSLYLSNDRELIEEYYRDRALETVNECKVIFLGDGAAGKSSLIERMVHDKFEKDSLPTDGVKMTKWSVYPDGKPLELDSKPLTLRFLDFGGQEIMHSMHRCFLTSHTVYVVVCDNRDDAEIDSVALRWMETVRAFAPDCPVILALNKSDMNPNVTVNERTLKAVNPNYRHTVRTSAKRDNDPGVQQLTDSILGEVPGCIRKMSGNRGFLALKNDLENMTDDYILPEQFRERCDRFQIKETVRESLLDWFQALGVAYAYAVTFRQVYVLNPAWLTNGIYRLILRTPNGGFLRHSDIRDTLGTKYSGDVDPDKT